jgi:hypothetical protein
MRDSINVVVTRDDIYRKEFSITWGDETRRVIIEREFVDDYHALWRWYFWQRKSIVWNPPPAEWPTWERALEEALNHITQTLQGADGQ